MVIFSAILIGALFIFSTLSGVRNFNLRLVKMLHLLQLEDYDPIRMLSTQVKRLNISKEIGLELGATLIAFSAMLLFGLLSMDHNPIADNYALLFFVGISIFSFALWLVGSGRDYRRINYELESAKKKFVMTDRAKRIWHITNINATIFLVVYLFIGFAYYLFFYNNLAHPTTNPDAYPFTIILPHIWEQTRLIFMISTVCVIVPVTAYIFSRTVAVFLTISVIALSPHEQLTQLRFMRDAKSILKEFNPLVIGITGSYGKTSVKEILAVLLARNYNVLKPPGSYNTLMGVTRVIREQLRHYHEVLIVEMGAYREGSISKLCNLTDPTHGLITIIGLQHLERFKTQKSIQRAKGELIRALPINGIAVLNADDPLSCEIGEDYTGKAVYFSMIGSQGGKEVVYVSNIELSINGSTFNINFPDGDIVTISLPFLGRAAIINTVAAIAMADSIGVDRIFMHKALIDIPQVAHRLELIRRKDGVNIIDDAFNSNPVGAAHALEVLSKATGGRRILITPGMVELGKEEEAANEEFGSLAANCCDLVILVGNRRIKPIEAGLVSAGFSAENIRVVPSFKSGMEWLESELKAGDTILIENDLPDQYDNL